MKKTLRFAIAQINCTVGDFDGNLKKIADRILEARTYDVDIVAFPELAITGYPPEDLLLKKAFVDSNLETLKNLASSVGDIVVITGFVDRKGRDLYNAAAVIYKGQVKGICHKIFLPNYGVFDEKRYFKPGDEPCLFKFGDILFGVNICEDIWHKDGPAKRQAAGGASFIVNINASPYYSGRIRERERIVQRQARDNRISIAYINLVGAQDELVFDGQSMIVNDKGRVIARAEAFREDLLIADIEITKRKASRLKNVVPIARSASANCRPALPKRKIAPLEPIAEIYQALVLGLRDYVLKNNFNKVVIGLSGGIDSSLVAALAVDALGKENVVGVFMPTRYSSSASEADSRKLACNLCIEFLSLSIDHIFKIYLMTLEPKFAGLKRDLAEENIQARIRGNILMALSNKFGWLVVTTGNKSEMSTGYATLYGDMAGGFAVIKDVPKMLVWRLAKYRNSISPVIPNSVITKAPTAELKHGQKDQDTLPPYSLLDKILKSYVEEDKGPDEMIRMGFGKEVVKKVVNMVDRSEYKRRQAPPGVKITPKAFGRDRRMPITNKYGTPRTRS